MKFSFIFSLALFICSCAPSKGPTVKSVGGSPEKIGLGFLPEQAEKGNLFKYYQPTAESKWRSNWTSTLDLTGVSWNDSRTATLISPSYVVMAAHFARPASVPVMFHDKNGRPYERFIAKVRSLAGVADIAVAKLNLPLPPSVKSYQFAKPSEATIGRPVIVTDQACTLSVHRIVAISGGVVQLGYIPEMNPVYGRNLIVGDSGNPSFLIVNDHLVLLETHTTGGPGAGPFYGDPKIQGAIRAAIAEMDQ